MRQTEKWNFHVSVKILANTSGISANAKIVHFYDAQLV